MTEENIICPSCNKVLSPRAEKCPKCNFEIKKTCLVCKEDIFTGIKICPNCGDPDPFNIKKKENLGIDSFSLCDCLYCEKSISNRSKKCVHCTTKTTVLCPHCNNKVSVWDSTCKECGEPEPFKKRINLVGNNTSESLSIFQVRQGSQADFLGIKENDILLKYNGFKVTNNEGLEYAIQIAKDEKTIQVVIIIKRGNEKLLFKAKPEILLGIRAIDKTSNKNRKTKKEKINSINTDFVPPDAHPHYLPSVTKPPMLKKSKDDFQSDNVTPKNNIFLDSLSSIEDKGEKSNLISTGNHPWRRYFARMVDVAVIGNITLIILIVLISVTFPELLRSINIEQDQQLIIFSVFLFALWIPVETLFLCTIGTTPAKWIFGISVTTTEGKKLNFDQALTRSIAVNVIGLWCGMPGLSMFPMYSAFKRLKLHGGQTYWDEKYYSKVTHKVWGFWRMSFCFLSVIVAFFSITILRNL